MFFERIRSKFENSQLFSSFIFTLGGSGISKLLLIVATFYCSNTLSELEFGEFSFVRNTLNMILCICALNFCNLVTKFTAEAKDSVRSLSRLVLLLLFSLFVSLCIGVSLALMKDAWMIKLLEYRDFIEYFRIAGLLLPFFMLQPLIEGVLRGVKQFKLIGVLQIFSSLLFILFIAIGIWYDNSRGAILGMYIYYFVYTVISVLSLILFKDIRQYDYKSISLKREIRTLYDMILPVFILSFVEAPIFWWLQVLLARHATVEAIGCMTIMKQIRNFSVLIPNYFVSTYLAFATELNIKKKYDLYFERFDKYSLLFLGVGCALVLIFSVFGQFILGLYGDGYPKYWYSLVLSNFCIPIVLVLCMIKMELIIQEHQKQLLFISFFWNVLWIVLFEVFVRLGIPALESFFYSEVLAVAVQLILCYYLYYMDKKRLLLNQTK